MIFNKDRFHRFVLHTYIFNNTYLDNYNNTYLS